MTRKNLAEAQPLLNQRAAETQAYGTLTRYPLGLSDEARKASVDGLNQLLADSITLRDMYKKHHWQLSGPTFYELHLLFDKHANEQTEIVDAVAERIQALGGVAIAMGSHTSQLTRLEPVPIGREEVPVQISRMLEAHEHILIEARALSRRATELGDDGTNDLLLGEVVRPNEAQVWFLSEHLVPSPLVRAR